MPVITNIEDLRVLAQKRVPRMFMTTLIRAVGQRALTKRTKVISKKSNCASVLLSIWKVEILRPT